MPKPIGAIIEPSARDTERGESVTFADSGRVEPDTDKTGSDRNEPEIIAGFESAEPDAIRIDSAGTGKRRGRPRGSTNRTRTETQKETPDSLVDLTTLLLSIHQMGAAMLNIQELAIDPKEAKSMADAIKEVAKYYPVAFDPKKLAIFNLVVVCGGIYGLRAMAYNNRMKEESKRTKLQVINQPQAQAKFTGTNPSDLWPLGAEEQLEF